MPSLEYLHCLKWEKHTHQNEKQERLDHSPVRYSIFPLPIVHLCQPKQKGHKFHIVLELQQIPQGVPLFRILRPDVDVLAEVLMAVLPHPIACGHRRRRRCPGGIGGATVAGAAIAVVVRI